MPSAFQILILYGAVLHSQAALPNNFYLDIDGLSVGVGISEICVLEAQIGVDIGGKPYCWGGIHDDEDIQNFAFAKKQTFVQIVSSQSFNCGLSIDQTVHCWAYYLPPHLVDIKGLYTQISAGSGFFCGVMTDGRLSCNGYSKGALNYPSDHGEKFVQVSCSFDYCCALDANGHVHCWGGPVDTHVITPPKLHTTIAADGSVIEEVKDSHNRLSHVRNDDIRDEEPEVLETKRVAEVQFKQISVGYEFACGIGYASGDLHCWGGAPRLKKLLKKAISGPFKQVSVGKLGACAIRVDDDGLQCFGAPMHSRLDQNPPRAGTKFDQVKVGPLSACAVDLDSQLHCWGGAQPDHEIVVA